LGCINRDWCARCQGSESEPDEQALAAIQGSERAETIA
jgi:hypothetical protein